MCVCGGGEAMVVVVLDFFGVVGVPVGGGVTYTSAAAHQSPIHTLHTLHTCRQWAHLAPLRSCLLPQLPARAWPWGADCVFSHTATPAGGCVGGGGRLRVLTHCNTGRCEGGEGGGGQGKPARSHALQHRQVGGTTSVLCSYLAKHPHTAHYASCAFAAWRRLASELLWASSAPCTSRCGGL